MLAVVFAASATGTEQWSAFETSYTSTKTYANPFIDVEVNVVFKQGDQQWIVPAFWAGEGKWTVRFAPPLLGEYQYRIDCSDKANTDLNGKNQTLRVTPYQGTNALLKHGFLKISADRRHFEHADGTPFLWLGDTWWKCLAKRLPWEGFQELTADRKAKGFSVAQIVCGPYPDEGAFEPRWENEGGKPYLTREFNKVNPIYFEFADRRFQHLIDNGIVPAIVGGWGRGDCEGMKMAGLDGIERHWRNLVAHYGAYPPVWIIGGEAGGPQWTEAARYVQTIDPYHRPSAIHPFESGRKAVTDETVVSFDMLQTGHGSGSATIGAIPKIAAAYAMNPPMPVLIGEHSYEGHMQTGFPDEQRYVFWGSMLSGAAGLTYGAAGIWHAGVEGDPGHTGAWGGAYDYTTWREGMAYPGSTQLGLGKRLLEKYPWSKFQPHPEWAPGCFAAGIPGEVVFVYLPRRNIYNWTGPEVKDLDPTVNWHAYYFDPATGRTFDQGILPATATDKKAAAVSFKKNVPSPQDWVLVIEKTQA